jgi:hypothetical protein
MPRKRYMPPEDLLQETIAQLENDEAPRGHRAALQALLSAGPLLCSDALLSTLQERDVEPWVEIRAELLAFLRSIVRQKGQGRFSPTVSLYQHVNFSAIASDDAQLVACAAEGSVRDLVVLQLVLLLHEVGLGQVRICEAPDCDRLFVKAYRREFCSTRCQKRTHTAAARAKVRQRAARRIKHQRRAR